MAEGDKEEGRVLISIPISKRRAYTALIVLLSTIAGAIGYPVVSMVTPERHSYLTDAQGHELKRRIGLLEQRITTMELQNRQTGWEINNHNH